MSFYTHTPDEGVLERWKDLIELALDYRDKANSPVTIDTDAEALEIFRAFTNASKARARNTGDLSDLSCFPVRWGEQAWRLAVSLHVAAHGDDFPNQVLTAKTAQQAVALAQWFSHHQLSLMSRSRYEKEEKRWQRLREILLSKEERSETLRNLRDRNGFQQKEVERLAQIFPDGFEIKEFIPEGGAGGRGSKRAVLKLNRR